MGKEPNEVTPGGAGPNDDKIVALQNSINDLTLQLSDLKKSKGEAAEIKRISEELTEARAELAALKKPAAGAGIEETTMTDDCELEGYEHGFFGL